MSTNLANHLNKKIKGMNLNEVEDIFVFGSAVKGKEFPSDIDLCIVFKKEISQKTITELQKKLKKIDTHISALTIDDFFKKPHTLAKTLLVEGISIFNKKPFAANFGFNSFALYSYDLSGLKPTDKVRFVQLLKGRKEEGIIKKLGGEWIANSCFLIPITKDNETQTILKKWAVPYKRKEGLIH